MRADEQPGEALALLRAASTLTGDGHTDPLTEAAVQRLVERGAASLVVPVPGHVTALDLDVERGRIAAALLGGDVGIWSLEDGRELNRWPAELGVYVRTIQLNGDGTQLLAGPDFGDLRAQDAVPARAFRIEDGALTHTFSHGAVSSSLKLSSDRERVATVSADDHKLLFWDTATGAPLATFPLDEAVTPPNIALSVDGARAAVSAGPVLRVLDLGAPDLSFTTGRAGAAARLAFVGPSDYLVACWGSGMGVWDSRSGELRGERDAPTGHGLVASESTDRFFEVGAGGGVLRAVPDLRPIPVQGGAVADPGVALFSRDGALLAVGSADGRVDVLDGLDGTLTRSLRGHRSMVLSIALPEAPGVQLLASGSRDNTIRLWTRPAPGQASLARLDLPETTNSARLSHGGSGVVWSTPGGLMIDDGEGRSKLMDLEPGVVATSLAARGAVAVAGLRPTARVALFDLGTRKPIAQVRVRSALRNVQITADGRRAVVSHNWGTELFALPSGDHLASWGSDRFSTLEVAPDASWAVGGDPHGLLTQLDLRDLGLAPREVQSSQDGWTSLATDGEGRWLVAGSWDGTASVLSTADWQVAHRLTGHLDSVVDVAMSSDGDAIATGSWDRTARLWDPSTGATRHVLTGHGSDLTALRFSDDGAVLWTGTRDGIVRAWDVAEGTLLAIHDGHRAAVRQIEPLPGGGARSLGKDLAVHSWPRPAPAGGLRSRAGELTNLRVCEGTTDVVPVVPFPEPTTVWAPGSACR